MDRPSFQFYPGDWLNNASLARCSWAAQGAWARILCLLHDQDPYGVIRWPLTEIARAIHAPLKLLLELRDKQVLKGSDDGLREPFTFAPRHAGKVGPEVILVATGTLPTWYSSRMVRDEYVRTKKATGAIASPLFDPPKGVPMGVPGEPPKGVPGHAGARAPARSPSPSPSSSLPTHPNPIRNSSLLLGGAGGEVANGHGAGRAGFPSPDTLRIDAQTRRDAGEEPETIAPNLLKSLGARYAAKAFGRADVTVQRVLDEYERAYNDPDVHDPVGILGNRLQLLPQKRPRNKSAPPKA